MSVTRTVVLALSLGLGGCAAQYSPPAPTPERIALPVSASFGRTWDAVIDVFSQGTIPIRTLDRSSGLIVAEQTDLGTPPGGNHPHPYADCGSKVVPRGASRARVYYQPESARYNIVVRGDSATSTVRVNATWSAEADLARVDPVSCTTTGVFETGLERRIKARAEAK